MANEKLTQEINEEMVAENTQAEETVAEKPVVLDMTLDEFKEKVEIKKFISIYAQKQIVEMVYSNCVVEDTANGIYYIDEIMQQVALDFAVLEHYTNFYDVIENAQAYTYDYLYEVGVFGYLNDKSKNGEMDVHNVCRAISNFTMRIADLNNVGSCLHRTIKEVVSNLPKVDLDKAIKGLTKALPKAINSIDKEVLNIFVKDLKEGKVLKMNDKK
jgi:hypothetical protein